MLNYDRVKNETGTVVGRGEDVTPDLSYKKEGAGEVLQDNGWTAEAHYVSK